MHHWAIEAIAPSIQFQGEIIVTTPLQPVGNSSVVQDPSALAFEQKLNISKSSQILVDYLKDKGKSAINSDELAKLANDTTGTVPADVSAAAAYMQRHPDVFTAIETNDVPGVDGLSGVWNFEWAANGGLNGTAIDSIAAMQDTFDRAIQLSSKVTEITTESKASLDSSKQRPQN